MNKIKKNNEACFVVCWFGTLPKYMPVWLKSCEQNPEFDFLLLTDDNINIEFPSNVKHIFFSKDIFLYRVKERLGIEPSLKEAYRLCDYRPMYGIILKEEISDYKYWGYCDIDVVFGCISNFLPISVLREYDAIFNGGHFTLIKNSEKMNYMFKDKGALFNYKTVITKHAIFAFDETTGFQRIVRQNKNVNAKFGIPYIETESKYTQLRSRLEISNPDIQAFYWEKGILYRVKAVDNKVFYQELAYIHLQKRKIELLDDSVVDSDSFWITPSGYKTKNYIGMPSAEDIKRFNPYEGEEELCRQAKKYRNKKIMQMLKRTPYQLFVRIRQQKAGINAEDGKREEMKWNCDNNRGE